MKNTRSTTVIKASILTCICALTLSLPFAIHNNTERINAEGRNPNELMTAVNTITTETTAVSTTSSTSTSTSTSTSPSTTTSTTSTESTTSTTSETTADTTPVAAEPDSVNTGEAVVKNEPCETNAPETTFDKSTTEWSAPTSESVSETNTETLPPAETTETTDAMVCPITGYTLSYSDAYYVMDCSLTKSGGVCDCFGHHETYYDEKILPGPGLNIPGRHVANDGTIRDENGYICVAAAGSYMAKGTILLTSLGPAKVYDSGCAWGTIDIYVNW